ncbi:hypothetical protein H5410_053190 [Solanum commersonii]|uniref:Uncharacterized protein n=1 Tax=Solanum commersonii TaxID=4109 RepID=A0A9J5X364_SOLCO|nr:hypothetical protein H5410_053190 [Solanum commersonii]
MSFTAKVRPLSSSESEPIGSNVNLFMNAPYDFIDSISSSISPSLFRVYTKKFITMYKMPILLAIQIQQKDNVWCEIQWMVERRLTIV